MAANNNKVGPFQIKDSSLVAISTGLSAQNLREFRDGIAEAPQASVYHHFWGRLLMPKFDEPEYNNDFAAWAAHGLNEKALAERLSVVDPTAFDDIEALRQELLDIIETRLDESEMVPWAKADQQFHFIRSQIVVLDTGRKVETPPELADAVPKMSSGSIYYHFIDARRRTPARKDDFSEWLAGFGEQFAELRARLSAIDPYFAGLKKLRKLISEVMDDYFREGLA